MYKSILVPVAYEAGFDISREIEVAQALVAPSGTVTLLHVMDPVPVFAIDYMPQGWREELERAIEDDMQRKAATLPGGRVAIVQDDPAHAIIDWANAQGVDCIVMATHRSNRALFGSTASRVARHASCAVHLIR